MRKIVVLVIHITIVIVGGALGYELGWVECRSGVAKDELVFSVRAMNALNNNKKNELTDVLRTQMFVAVSSIHRLSKNPIWKGRYMFGSPFNDKLTRYLLPMAEKESASIGEEYYPQLYPAKRSGTIPEK